MRSNFLLASIIDSLLNSDSFGYGLSVFLSALGLLAGGDLPTGKYSLGGADSRVPNTIGPALGLDSHGVFEIDGSITRQDIGFGNNANFLLQRWEEYVDIANQNGGLFNEMTQAQDNGLRYDNSRNTNPTFFAGAIWFAVSHAERVFVYEGLPNGTNQNVADYQNVAPFFLDEKFPEQWVSITIILNILNPTMPKLTLLPVPSTRTLLPSLSLHGSRWCLPPQSPRTRRQRRPQQLRPAQRRSQLADPRPNRLFHPRKRPRYRAGPGQAGDCRQL